MSWTSNTLGVKCEPPLFKEMYKLAKDKKASRMFIVNEILDDGFNASAQGRYFLFHSLLEYSFYMNGLHDFVDLSALITRIFKLWRSFCYCEIGTRNSLFFTRTYNEPLLLF